MEKSDIKSCALFMIINIDELIVRLEKIKAVHGGDLPIIVNGINGGHGVGIGIYPTILVKPRKDNFPEFFDRNDICAVITGQ